LNCNLTLFDHFARQYFYFISIILLGNNIIAQDLVRTLESSQEQRSETTSFTTVYSETQCGLNYTQATIALNQRRGGYNNSQTQPATLNISGIPTGATIKKAFLYYNIEGYSSVNPDFTFTLKNPINQIMTLLSTEIASGPSTCGEPAVGSASFRNDVTGIITGNGSYEIDGIPTSMFPPDSPDANGASLFIIFIESNSNFIGTIVMVDGHEVSLVAGQHIQCDISGFTVPTTITSSAGFALIGDDQTFIPNTALINGVSVPFIDGDAFTIAEGPIGLSPGQNSSTHSIIRGGDDCFSLSMTGIYFQDSDAAACMVDNNSIPTASEWGIVILFFLLLIISIIHIKSSIISLIRNKDELID